MPLPNVIITLGNGNLGRTTPTTDSVAGLILTGLAVPGALELNRHYLLGSTADLATLGIKRKPETPIEGEVYNQLAHSEISNFYAQAGEGAELHLVVVSEATTLSQICDPSSDSPLCKLIDSSGGRIRLVAVNRIYPGDGKPDAAAAKAAVDDLKTAVTSAHQCAEAYAKKVKPFRVLLPFAPPMWDGSTTDLYAPAKDSANRVGVVAICNASGELAAHPTTAMVLGRAAAIEVHRSVGRVKDGAIAPDAMLPNGKSFSGAGVLGEILNDAGYIVPIGYPTKNGAYLNGDPMAAPITDDYSSLAYGRVIDKAAVICYATYIDEILDNIEADENGNVEIGACKSFEAMIENAIAVQMSGQISSFNATIDPAQNILSSGTLSIDCRIVPRGVLHTINVNLAFENPNLKQ